MVILLRVDFPCPDVAAIRAEVMARRAELAKACRLGDLPRAEEAGAEVEAGLYA